MLFLCFNFNDQLNKLYTKYMKRIFDLVKDSYISHIMWLNKLRNIGRSELNYRFSIIIRSNKKV